MDPISTAVDDPYSADTLLVSGKHPGYYYEKVSGLIACIPA